MQDVWTFWKNVPQNKDICSLGIPKDLLILYLNNLE